jgi:hypothetical protein
MILIECSKQNYWKNLQSLSKKDLASSNDRSLSSEKIKYQEHQMCETSFDYTFKNIIADDSGVGKLM